jgi:hypothetical protein
MNLNWKNFRKHREKAAAMDKPRREGGLRKN